MYAHEIQWTDIITQIICIAWKMSPRITRDFNQGVTVPISKLSNFHQFSGIHLWNFRRGGKHRDPESWCPNICGDYFCWRSSRWSLGYRCNNERHESLWIHIPKEINISGTPKHEVNGRWLPFSKMETIFHKHDIPVVSARLFVKLLQ